jgi:hypothetical protein
MRLLYRKKSNFPYVAHFAIVSEDGKTDILDVYHEKLSTPQDAHSKIKKIFNINHEGKLPTNITPRIIFDNHYVVSRVRRELMSPDYPELRPEYFFGSPMNPDETKELIGITIMNNIFEEMTGKTYERYLEDRLVWNWFEPPIQKHDSLLREVEDVVSEMVSRI